MFHFFRVLLERLVCSHQSEQLVFHRGDYTFQQCQCCGHRKRTPRVE